MPTVPSLRAARPIYLCSDSRSALAVLPRKRKSGSWSLMVPGAGKAVRINKEGEADLNGKPNGPYAEFVPAEKDGALALMAAKSGLWLTVDEDGSFRASGEPVDLRLELPEGAEEGAPEQEEDDEEELDDDTLGPLERLACAEAGGAIGRELPWPVQRKVKRTTAGGRRVVLLQATHHGKAPGAKYVRASNHGSGTDVDCGGKGGQWSQWEELAREGGLVFKNVGTGKFLCVSAAGAYQAQKPMHFAAEPTEFNPTPMAALPVDRSVLTAEDLEAFRTQGYVVLRGAVAPHLVDGALRVVNAALGRSSSAVEDGGLLLGPRGNKGPIYDVFNHSRVWSALNVLLGEGNVLPKEAGGVQVALRFPKEDGRGVEHEDAKPGKKYHIDGMDKNILCPFSVLCGVSLSDQTRPNSGNLHVFPGSHLHCREWYRSRLGEGGAGEDDTSKPNLGRSTQVLLAPGDVVLAHQLLAHRIGKNHSPHIRYQLYYRVQHKDHEALKPRICDDVWTEFPGVREASRS